MVRHDFRISWTAREEDGVQTMYGESTESLTSGAGNPKKACWYTRAPDGFVFYACASGERSFTGEARNGSIEWDEKLASIYVFAAAGKVIVRSTFKACKPADKGRVRALRPGKSAITGMGPFNPNADADWD